MNTPGTRDESVPGFETTTSYLSETDLPAPDGEAHLRVIDDPMDGSPS